MKIYEILFKKLILKFKSEFTVAKSCLQKNRFYLYFSMSFSITNLDTSIRWWKSSEWIAGKLYWNTVLNTLTLCE